MGVNNYDKGKNFQMSANLSVKIYRWKDKAYQNPEECILVDIGVGGACVNSEHKYAENEILYFQIKLENYRVISLLGQVIRVTEAECGQYRYSILFPQVWDSEHIYLSYILNRISSKDAHNNKSGK